MPVGENRRSVCAVKSLEGIIKETHTGRIGGLRETALRTLDDSEGVVLNVNGERKEARLPR